MNGNVIARALGGRKCRKNPPLDPVDARPGRNQGEDLGDEVHQETRRVAPVAAGLPQLVQAGPSDYQGRIHLKTVHAEGRVLKQFLHRYKKHFVWQRVSEGKAYKGERSPIRNLL